MTCVTATTKDSSIATTPKSAPPLPPPKSALPPPKKITLHPEKTTSSQSNRAQVSQKKTISSPFKRLQPPLSYEKTDAELEASMRLEVEKWMASLKKAPPPKKSAKELGVKHKMLRCLAQPILSNYKCTMMNPHCAKRSYDILENEDEQMIKFCHEAGLSLEQLHGQSKIQMAYATKTWECHTRFLCQDRVLIVCMTQNQMFHTYGQKCSQITKCNNTKYNYYINIVFID
jgi:hypothetical protein